MAADVKTNVSHAWHHVTAVLSLNKQRIGSFDKEFQGSVAVIVEQGLWELLKTWFFDEIRSDLEERIVPQFFGSLYPAIAQHEYKDCLKDVSNAIKFLFTNFCSYNSAVEILQKLSEMQEMPVHIDNVDKKCEVFKESVKDLLKGVMLSQLPLDFVRAFQNFYQIAFKAFLKSEKQDADDSADFLLKCSGCDYDREHCQCDTVLELFHEANRQLYELDLLERLGGDALTSVIHEHIRNHVQSTCKGNFEKYYLSSLEDWLDTMVVGWLRVVYCGNSKTADANTETAINSFKNRLTHLLYVTFVHVRMEQMFNIIIDFPESQPALADLKCCLERTNLRAKLIANLKESLEARLLHPGVNTSDILLAYVSAIKAMYMLDPTGVILNHVCEPVRRYLKTREDTVKCIVSNLTDENSSELADELVKGDPLVLDESCPSDDEGDDWRTWQPDSVDADPGMSLKSKRASDIISMLVNIYGSKELFVNEYRTLLADRILSHLHLDTEKEIRYLELLKLRFGESHLHNCEVMLKDVGDSKRINSHIFSEEAKKRSEEMQVSAIILSAQFWPAFREEQLELPVNIKEALDRYTKSFETLKGNRTLSWKSHLGLVTLSLELKNRTLHFSVTPAHAVIISHYETKSKWTIEELSSVMKMPHSALRRKMAYWQIRGVVREEAKDVFVLVEDDQVSGHDVPFMVEEEEKESAMASSGDQREEELQVLWSYVLGMLTNLESLSIERIHSTLKMFATQSPTASDCSIQELGYFLDRKVKEHKLLFSGGLYRLPKPGT